MEETKKKSPVRILIPIIVLCLAAVGIFGFINGQKKKQAAYDAAAVLLAEDKYEEAIAAFAALGNFQDAAEQMTVAQEEAYALAAGLLEEQKYGEAIAVFASLGDFRDAAVQVTNAQEEAYILATTLLNEKKYEDAEVVFTSLGDYKDSQQKAEEAVQVPKDLYQKALDFCENSMYDEAYAIFKELGTYQDAAERLGDFLMLPSALVAANQYGTSDYRYTYNLDGKLVNVKFEKTTSRGEDSYTYDEDGNLIKLLEHLEYFDKNATYSYAKSDVTSEYTYDEYGNLLQEDWKKTGNISYRNWSPKTTYEYDENNRMIKKSKTISGQGKPDVTQWCYDEEGNEILETYDWKEIYVTIGDGNTRHNVTQIAKEYDENGYLSKAVYYYKEGEDYTSFTRDSDGNLLTMVDVELDGSTTKMVCNYDENGNLLKKETTEPDGSTVTIVYSYDANGNMLQQQTTEADGSVVTTLWNYDEGNRLTKIVTTYADGTKYIDAYTYDENGNMLTKSTRNQDGNTSYEYSDYLIFYRPGKNNDQRSYYSTRSYYYIY